MPKYREHISAQKYVFPVMKEVSNRETITNVYLMLLCCVHCWRLEFAISFAANSFHGFSSLFCNYAIWCTADNLINNQYYSQPWLQHGGTKCGTGDIWIHYASIIWMLTPRQTKSRAPFLFVWTVLKNIRVNLFEKGKQMFYLYGKSLLTKSPPSCFPHHSDYSCMS